jgi:hypothetical protein
MPSPKSTADEPRGRDSSGTLIEAQCARAVGDRAGQAIIAVGGEVLGLSRSALRQRMLELGDRRGQHRHRAEHERLGVEIPLSGELYRATWSTSSARRVSCTARRVVGLAGMSASRASRRTGGQAQEPDLPSYRPAGCPPGVVLCLTAPPRGSHDRGVARHPHSPGVRATSNRSPGTEPSRNLGFAGRCLSGLGLCPSNHSRFARYSKSPQDLPAA